MLFVHICKHRLYISQFKNICKSQIVPVIGFFTCNNCINIIKKVYGAKSVTVPDFT